MTEPSDTEPDIEEICDELSDAAQLCEDECGEYWESLVNLHPRICDGGSPAFKAAWEAEVKSQYKRLKEEFEIETVTLSKTYSYREISYVGPQS